MFGLFKKKPKISKQELEAASVVLDMVHLGVSLQLNRVFDSQNDAILELVECKRGCGYVFGFNDGMLQGFRGEKRNEDWEDAVLTASYDKVFGNDGGGAVMLGRALALQGDPEFFVGQQVGGNEAVAMMRDKGMPMGLWRMLRPDEASATT